LTRWLPLCARSRTRCRALRARSRRSVAVNASDNLWPWPGARSHRSPPAYSPPTPPTSPTRTLQPAAAAHTRPSNLEYHYPPTHTHTHVPTTTATSTPTGSGPRLLASGVAVLRAAVAADAAIETAEQKANVEEAHRLRAEFADAASSLRREVSTRFHPLPPHLRLRCYRIRSNVQTRVVNSFAPWRVFHHHLHCFYLLQQNFLHSYLHSHTSAPAPAHAPVS